jgi:predicted enzyme related to lactoylglutathione lyase
MQEDSMSHGTFCWNELMTHDVERAKKFYRDTVGWTFDAMTTPIGTYWIAKQGDKQVGGIFPMNGAEFADMSERWVSYLAVDDVDARLKKAVAGGAKVMKQPFDIPKVGRIAFVEQPGGAMVAWMTPKP